MNHVVILMKKGVLGFGVLGFWGKEAPLQNCRSCQYSVPSKEGSWFCEKFNETLEYGKQLKGCDLWTAF